MHAVDDLRAGLGLRAPHIAAVIAARPPVPFFEVHAENHMGEGPEFAALAAVRRDYPVSIHGVGLSLGSPESDPEHLARLVALVARIEPMLVSDHLAWSIAGGAYLNDLIAIPYTEASLAAVARNVARAQDALRRPILIENPAPYIAYRDSTMGEAEFLAALSRRTGCGVLLDVNNVHVAANNVGLDPARYFAALPAAAVGAFHIAGHEPEVIDGETVLIDTHGAPVCEAVWSLFRAAVARFGPRPTLLERDRNIPPLDELIAEARIADATLAGQGARHVA